MAAGESSGNVALDAKIKEWLTYDKVLYAYFDSLLFVR